MAYIKQINIKGFKKFKKFEINFNEKLNIIIGENEVGKSTILEAIDIVINQKYKNTDKYIVGELLNKELITKFEEEPCIENLPEIYIELEFENLDNKISNKKYNGTNNSDNREANGIFFKCEFDVEYLEDFLPSIESGKIPYEYYKFYWGTFSGESYKAYKKTYNAILIDNSIIDSNSSFNSYNKSLFYSKNDLNERLNIKYEFRNKLMNVLDETNINKFDKKEKIDENIKFGINDKKVILENLLTIYEDNISIENKGKGKENLIKTEMSLQKERFLIDTVLLEEPENHLSYSNLLLMISKLKLNPENSQLIITTHESLIASRLNLNNIIWIVNNKESFSLSKIEKSTAEFFVKADDNTLLQFLLSNKVILVEGPTEYLLLPRFFEEIYNEKLEENNISIISCHGISYNRYLEIAKVMNKKVCVITDNDEKEDKIEDKIKYNKNRINQKIFTDDDVKNWTWEVCLFNENQKILNEKIKVKKGAEYSFKGKSYKDNPVLGKMLNNKVETAFNILSEEIKLEVPKYIKEAFEWIK